MILFDTHAHYNDEKLFADSDSLINESHESGVEKIVNVADSLKSISVCRALSEKYDYLYFSSGVHPSEAMADMQNKAWLDIVEENLKHEKAVAIGEIGLDYHYGKEDIREQKECFAAQLTLAQKSGYPVIVHDREAHEDCLDILFSFDNIKCVMHSFSGSAEMAKELFKRGHYISVNGVVTFKNARRICEILQMLPELHKDAKSRLLLETDCPYLTPEPFRGQRNFSKYMYYTALRVSELTGIEPNELSRLTYRNGCEFYGMECGDKL